MCTSVLNLKFNCTDSLHVARNDIHHWGMSWRRAGQEKDWWITTIAWFSPRKRIYSSPMNNKTSIIFHILSGTSNKTTACRLSLTSITVQLAILGVGSKTAVTVYCHKDRLCDKAFSTIWQNRWVYGRRICQKIELFLHCTGADIHFKFVHSSWINGSICSQHSTNIDSRKPNVNWLSVTGLIFGSYDVHIWSRKLYTFKQTWLGDTPSSSESISSQSTLPVTRSTQIFSFVFKSELEYVKAR